MWRANRELLGKIRPDDSPEGFLVTDDGGRTSVSGLYAAGDIVVPGPQQMIIAAGSGARVAASIVNDLQALHG